MSNTSDQQNQPEDRIGTYLQDKRSNSSEEESDLENKTKEGILSKTRLPRRRLLQSSVAASMLLGGFSEGVINAAAINPKSALLTNPGFDRGLTGWNVQEHPDEGQTPGKVTTVNNSAKMTVAGTPSTIVLTQRLKSDLPKGSTITVEFESRGNMNCCGGLTVYLTDQPESLFSGQSEKIGHPDHGSHSLTITANKDYQEGDGIQLRASIWPGKGSIIVNNIDWQHPKTGSSGEEFTSEAIQWKSCRKAQLFGVGRLAEIRVFASKDGKKRNNDDEREVIKKPSYTRDENYQKGRKKQEQESDIVYQFKKDEDMGVLTAPAGWTIYNIIAITKNGQKIRKARNASGCNFGKDNIQWKGCRKAHLVGVDKAEKIRVWASNDGEKGNDDDKKETIERPAYTRQRKKAGKLDQKQESDIVYQYKRNENIGALQSPKNWTIYKIVAITKDGRKIQKERGLQSCSFSKKDIKFRNCRTVIFSNVYHINKITYNYSDDGETDDHDNKGGAFNEFTSLNQPQQKKWDPQENVFYRYNPDGEKITIKAKKGIAIFKVEVQTKSGQKITKKQDIRECFFRATIKFSDDCTQFTISPSQNKEYTVRAWDSQSDYWSFEGNEGRFDRQAKNGRTWEEVRVITDGDRVAQKKCSPPDQKPTFKITSGRTCQMVKVKPSQDVTYSVKVFIYGHWSNNTIEKTLKNGDVFKQTVEEPKFFHEIKVIYKGKEVKSKTICPV